jgi:hypothetical protein
LRKANTIPDSGVLIQPRGKKQYTRAFPDSDMAKNQRKKMPPRRTQLPERKRIEEMPHGGKN